MFFFLDQLSENILLTKKDWYSGYKISWNKKNAIPN